jgi:hypothetical protein
MKLSTLIALSFLSMVFPLNALGQMTPSDDSYTLTSSPSTNFGAKNAMLVESSGATAFVRFDLSGIPSSVTGSTVAKGTLKIFVATVPTAGSFNVDLVTSSWTERTITANNSPSLGSAIASAIPITTADKDQYILIDVTTAVVDWLNGTPNDGLALVPDGAVSFTLNSKETTTTSHPAELDIVLTGPAGPQGPAGPISGVTAGPGLTGGGTKGTVTVSMLTSCSKNQVLQWNGSSWACSSAGTGTITGVTAGTDLTGGGTGGNVTLNLNTAATDARYAQLAAANSFISPITISNNTSAIPLVVSQSDTAHVDAAIQGSISSGQNGSVALEGIAGATSGSVFGVAGVAQSGAGAGVYGVNGHASSIGSEFSLNLSGVWGDSSSGTGLMATSDSGNGVFAINNSYGRPAVEAWNLNPATADNYEGPGIEGFSYGMGMIGYAQQFSHTFVSDSGYQPIGVTGDTGFTGGIGVWGTADSGYAIVGENNGPYVTALLLNSSSSPSYALEAGTLSKNCLVDTQGDLTCTGAKSAAVQLPDQRWVRLYAVESPENWFEDFGSGQLLNGSAQITLEPTFAATVNTGADYRVFPVPNGDCKGLYVAEKTAAGFVVRELGGGASNIAFDYRIVARRKGYEDLRMEDVTEKRNQLMTANRKMVRTNASTRKYPDRTVSYRSPAGIAKSGADDTEAVPARTKHQISRTKE